MSASETESQAPVAGADPRADGWVTLAEECEEGSRTAITLEDVTYVDDAVRALRDAAEALTEARERAHRADAERAEWRDRCLTTADVMRERLAAAARGAEGEREGFVAGFRRAAYVYSDQAEDDADVTERAEREWSERRAPRPSAGPAASSFAEQNAGLVLDSVEDRHRLGMPVPWTENDVQIMRALLSERCTPAARASDDPAREVVAFDLDAFSAENRARCEAPDGFNHPIGSWSLSDWMTATLGELGEAANVAKKLNRVRDGVRGNRESEAELRQKLGSEIADAFIYLDLLAQSQGLALSEVVRRTFDAKSAQIGYRAALVAPAAPEVPRG